MTIGVVPYTQERESAWDECCAGSINGSFLHTRRFLNYHGDRFVDLSLLIYDSERLAGVFPAAECPTDPAIVVSHPGATFGGIVHQGRLVGMRMIEAINALQAHYREEGYRKLVYKAVPYIHARAPAQDDLYALFRLGATRVRCDLSCTIDLVNRQPPSDRRGRCLKKAKKLVTVVSDSKALLSALWAVVEENLSRKHQLRPVHTLTELALLVDRFPADIRVQYALVEDRVEAGVVFFNSPTVWHAQYTGASTRGYEASALDAVFESAIETAQTESARYFDFGVSTEDNGRALNDGLYRFKAEFGGTGVALEFYELELGN